MSEDRKELLMYLHDLVTLYVAQGGRDEKDASFDTLRWINNLCIKLNSLLKV